MSDNYYSKNKDFEEIDFSKMFRFLLMQSKLIISIVLIIFVISYINFSLSTKKYLIQSLIQYESLNQNIFDPSSSASLRPYGSSSDISNLIALYESRTNYLKVIKDLKLNIDVIDLDDDENIDISISSDKENEFAEYILRFSFSDKGFNLLDDELSVIQTSEYGGQIDFNGLEISIKSSDLNEYRPIDVHFKHPESMYNSLKSQMNVVAYESSRSSFFSNEGLISVSYISDDIEMGKEIINYANNIFLKQRISVETEKSRKAIDFIDQNIRSLEEIVEGNKVKLKEFREKNKSIDVGLEIEAIINKIQSLDESLSSIDIEIAKSKEIYTTNNPVYQNLLNKKKLLEKQKDAVLSEIEMMPKEQQEYIDLYNDVEVSQSFFKELESRRLGFSILEASTIGDIRIVDNAYVDSLVSPNFITVLVSAFMSFIIACIIAIIRGFNFLPLSNPAEIFDNNIHIPIIGVIPEIDDISATDDIRLNTSIESLIVNINAIQNDQKDKKIITISSPSPFNGKSTISMKLAEGFAKIGKKVLLVDNDLKRGKIAKNYNIKNISESTFNSIDETSINDYLVHDNFYIIPRVKGLNNTFQFLYNYNYQEKIQFFKDYFDFIIFDTGPILSVADSSILIEKSDFNLLIVRHGINRMNEIKQSIENYNQINKHVDGIIYNAYAKPKSYYGYYGIYGDYSYQYYAEKYLEEAYDYEKQD